MIDMKTSPFRPGLFNGRTYVVTGGGTGMGRAVALELASLGARVAICGRRPEPINAVAEEIKTLGHECLAMPCDIREPALVNAFVDAVLTRFSRIDGLVNNAGGQFVSPALAMSPNGFAAVVKNNLLGTFNMTHAIATKAFLESGGGRVVNVTAQVQRGFPGMAHTGAARAGVENLARTLAVEWAPMRIQVNTIAPGTIRSTGTDNYPPEFIERSRTQTPSKRLGTVEEVAHLACYLLSDAADFITGSTFTIDGGGALWGNIWDVPEPG